LIQEIDAGDAPAEEHDEVGVGGGFGRTAGSGFDRSLGGSFGRVPVQLYGPVLIMEGNVLFTAIFHGHDVQPPLHNPVGLGKETVTADVHAVALIVDGLGNAPDIARLLKDDGNDVRPLQQFVGGGQSGRSSSDDDGLFLQVIIYGWDGKGVAWGVTSS